MRPDGPGAGSGPGGAIDWCALVSCLFGPGTIDDQMVKRLAGMGVHVERLRACLEKMCREKPCRCDDKLETTTIDAATLSDLRRVLAVLGDRLR